jgi:MSHA biogenesis protein MshN
MSTELTLLARPDTPAVDGLEDDARASSRRDERRRDAQPRRAARESGASRDSVVAPSANVMAAFGSSIVPGAASQVAASSSASMASVAAGEAAARPTPRPAEGPPARIERQEREPTARERAETGYRRGVEAMHEGRAQPAEQLLREALTLSPAHEAARQTLLGMLIEQKRNADAEVLLLEGQRQNPAQLGFAMALARLQVERGDVGSALDTLQRSSAAGRERPEFIAFQAGLLARAGRAREAAQQYQAALRMSPQTGVWWMGMAMSLEADKRPAEAAEAFQRARDSNSLNAELTAFVEQRMRGLQGR